MEKLLDSYLVKWTLLCAIVGLLVGCAVAIFLLGLDEIYRFTLYEDSYIYFLPLAGLVIGFAYHYWGKVAVKGNNLILEEIHHFLVDRWVEREQRCKLVAQLPIDSLDGLS